MIEGGIDDLVGHAVLLRAIPHLLHKIGPAVLYLHVDIKPARSEQLVNLVKGRDIDLSEPVAETGAEAVLSQFLKCHF